MNKDMTGIVRKIDDIRNTPELEDCEPLLAQGYRIACDRIISMLCKEYGAVDEKLEGKLS